MSRFKSSMILALIGCAFIGCAFIENRLLYHPEPAKEKQPRLPDTVHDVRVVSADGSEIHARWCRCPESDGAILYCPGNAGNLEGRAHLVYRLVESLNLSVLIFDYPGFGRSKGRPSESGCYQAADAAYRWLVDKANINPKRIVLYGESLGGGVATNLASRKPHRALILARTFSSVPDVAQAHISSVSVHNLMVNRFDSLAIIAKCKGPIFIACGEKDQLIPIEHGRKLRAAATAPVELFLMKNAGHNDLPGADYYDALNQFLQNKAPVAWN